VFFVRYLRSELVRRRGRTVLTLLGLGLGVALVVALSSVSAGLSDAQKKTLNPLAGIGTDLTVTLSPQQQDRGGFGPGGSGGGSRDLIAANSPPDHELALLRLRSFGFVFQQFNLIPTLTALENVEAKLAPTGIDDRDLQDRALALLEEVGLAERAIHLPAHMSGGEQQRVAIARALSTNDATLAAHAPRRLRMRDGRLLLPV
jgi:putative ABC transport system ATP-binding protein